eukprot:scaffold843_cov255-Pinguiococcus_pyrenoidosus.AAC.7
MAATTPPPPLVSTGEKLCGNEWAAITGSLHGLGGLASITGPMTPVPAHQGARTRAEAASPHLAVELALSAMNQSLPQSVFTFAARYLNCAPITSWCATQPALLGDGTTRGRHCSGMALLRARLAYLNHVSRTSSSWRRETSSPCSLRAFSKASASFLATTYTSS